MQVLITLCLLITWHGGMHPHKIKLAKAKLRKIDVILTTEALCPLKKSANVVIKAVDEVQYAGMAFKGSFGQYMGFIGIWVDKDVRRKDRRRYLSKVLAHEAGHVLGMEHNDNERSIMFPYYTHRRQKFLPEDVKQIERLYE